MALRDYLPSFLRREPQATPDLLGELTPAERTRLNAPPDNVDRAERLAERMSDATDPMHDKMRERQADNYLPRHIAASAARIATKPARWSEPTQEREGRGRGR